MNRNGDFLKILAMVTMLIDHIGYLFYPKLTILRIIGRIAFPIFAYLIARGYRYTHNFNKYALRLFAFGIISQLPYSIFAPGKLNIMFTLLIGLFALRVYDSKWQYFSFAFILLGIWLPISYGAYGIFMILIFHITYSNNLKKVLGYLILSAAYYYDSKSWIQACSVLALIPLTTETYFESSFKKVFPFRLNKWAGYVFYPVHIFLLLGIYYFG